MHQGGTLQRMVLMTSQTLACQTAQFRINQRDQGFPRRSISLAPSRE
jgi:hypothetical protein